MKRAAVILIAGLAALLSVCSCGKKEEKDPERHGQVLILYAANFNNLSLAIDTNIDELCNEDLPSLGSPNAVVVFAHSTSYNKNYSTPTEPCIYRMYRKDGLAVRDTIYRFPKGADSASKELLRSTLSIVKEKLPADKYGLIFNSHGTGWIPPGYSENNTTLFAMGERPDYPETKSMGMMVHQDGSTLSEIELADFADAIPMKMEYIIFDACLMSCVEVAYQLRKCCNYFLASPTEILKSGLVYTKMQKSIYGSTKESLTQICQDYIDYYNSQSGYARSASITLVDCSQLDGLASSFRSIMDRHYDDVMSLNRNLVQPYFYDEKEWFFDLRDIAAHLNSTGEELKRMDAALKDCILYEDHTPYFFDQPLENVCGLSCYLPTADRTELNSYYLKLDWNKATGLVR